MDVGLSKRGVKSTRVASSNQLSASAGENPLPPDDPNKELMGKTEVSLTLTNKFDVPGEANTETDAKTLLLKSDGTPDSARKLAKNDHTVSGQQK